MYLPKNAPCYVVVTSRVENGEIIELRVSGAALTIEDAFRYYHSEINYLRKEGYTFEDEVEANNVTDAIFYKNEYDTARVRLQISALMK